MAGPDTRERCSVPECRRRIGKLDRALRLRTGQVVCPACQQNGTDLPRCPSCGAYCLPGSYVVRDAGQGRQDVRCPACAPEDAIMSPGSKRTGLAPRGGNL